jgi:hypothetical protein
VEARGAAAAKRAGSQDRLDLYLTPYCKMSYTLRRIRHHIVRCISPDVTFETPSVTLFSPPAFSVSKDADAVSPICAVGAGEIIVASNTESMKLTLGARIRGLSVGAYTAALTVRSGTGAATVFRSHFFVPSDHADSVIRPREITLSPDQTLVFTIGDEGAPPLYRSAPIRVREEGDGQRHRYLFGAAGSRLFDRLFVLLTGMAVVVPFTAFAWYTARRIREQYPELAADRARTSPKWLRPLAPAFFRDTSRWVHRDGTLQPGSILKLETLAPDKRPLFGSLSLFLRHMGLDELPQLITIWNGEWSVLGPRAVPNRDGLLAPGGSRVQNSRDLLSRYRLGESLRKPGVLSLRVAMTPRGSVELPPWRTMLLYDRYDSMHWSFSHAALVVTRLLLALVWSDGLKDHLGPAELQAVEERDAAGM